MHNITRLLTIRPSPLEQTPWGIRELWLLLRETRCWRHAECRLVQRHALPEPLPSACTDLTKRWCRERPSSSLAYCSRSALRSRSYLGVEHIARLCRGCGTRAKTVAKSDRIPDVVTVRLTPFSSSTLQTRRRALAARTTATVWMEIRLPKPEPWP